MKRLEKTNITDEQGVANIYDKTAATFCAPLASTLALHPTTSTGNWTGLLIWSQSVSSSSYAVIDGELRIFQTTSDDVVTEHGKIVETMEKETRRIFEDIRDSRSPFAPWVMKSPFTGPLEVMFAVPDLVGDFSWTSCTHLDCSTDVKHIKEHEKITNIKTGVDVMAPPWHLEVNLFATKRQDDAHYNYTLGGPFRKFR